MLHRAAQFTMTTSWDDGHPLDFRIADLLAKHGLPGTFYVPKENLRPTLSSSQIRELSRGFELGAHTIHHTVLAGLPDSRARAEIVESKRWMEDLSGRECTVFCFPSGRYGRMHLEMIRCAGFSGARTVELMSLGHPRLANGIALIPTTVQAYAHSVLAYLRNAAKRRRPKAFWNTLLYVHGEDWSPTAISLLERARETGGVFHLWGHSWEIEESGQWKELDRVLAAMGQYNRAACCVTNAELCVRQEQARP